MKRRFSEARRRVFVGHGVGLWEFAGPIENLANPAFWEARRMILGVWPKRLRDLRFSRQIRGMCTGVAEHLAPLIRFCLFVSFAFLVGSAALIRFFHLIVLLVGSADLSFLVRLHESVSVIGSADQNEDLMRYDRERETAQQLEWQEWTGGWPVFYWRRSGLLRSVYRIVSGLLSTEVKGT